MKLKISIIYSWVVRSILIFLPNVPLIMRFRGFLYSIFMQECGSNFQVSANVILNSLSGLSVGKNVYIASNTIFISSHARIGDNVLIGPGCVISSGNHTMFQGSFRYGKVQSGIVTIGSGSWIAANCTVTCNSSLPESSLLAANSVLTKPYEELRGLYAGVPAKFIKKL